MVIFDKVEPGFFGGSDDVEKVEIFYNDKTYIGKFNARFNENKKKVMMTSYKNSIYSEYVCSKIIKELGLNVQNVLIGLANRADGKQREVVACENFLTDNAKFVDIKTSIIRQNANNNPRYLDDTLFFIRNQKYINPTKLEKFYWEQFSVDAILGNFDRHNRNWNLLYRVDYKNERYYDLCPIFDNASSLYPFFGEIAMEQYLTSKKQVNLANYPYHSLVDKNNKKISYFDYLSQTNNEILLKVFSDIYDKIKFNRINDIINELSGVITDVHINFFKKIFSDRCDLFYEPYQRAKALSKNVELKIK